MSTLAIVGAGLLAAAARAQDAIGDAPVAAPPAEEPAWTFGLSAYHYSPPEDDDYLQPTVTADRGALHLEVRHNYEDRDTASAWVGTNLSTGDEVSLELTPMLGAAVGDTDGVAVGYRGALGWERLELFSEGEYLYDLDEADDSFFYNWSELTVSPADWLRAGLVVQRTRAYESDLDVQRGLLLGVSFDRLAVTAHVFDPDQDDPVWVVSLAVEL